MGVVITSAVCVGRCQPRMHPRRGTRPTGRSLRGPSMGSTRSSIWPARALPAVDGRQPARLGFARAASPAPASCAKNWQDSTHRRRCWWPRPRDRTDHSTARRSSTRLCAVLQATRRIVYNPCDHDRRRTRAPAQHGGPSARRLVRGGPQVASGIAAEHTSAQDSDEGRAGGLRSQARAAAARCEGRGIDHTAGAVVPRGSPRWAGRRHRFVTAAQRPTRRALNGWIQGSTFPPRPERSPRGNVGTPPGRRCRRTPRQEKRSAGAPVHLHRSRGRCRPPVRVPSRCRGRAGSPSAGWPAGRRRLRAARTLTHVDGRSAVPPGP